MSIIKFIVGFVIGTMVGGEISNNLAIQTLIAAGSGLFFASLGSKKDDAKEKELQKIIEKHENEIVDCPVSMGKYKNDLINGQLSYDTELNEIDIIVSDQERSKRWSEEEQQKFEDLMQGGVRMEDARSAARNAVLHAESALRKVSNMLMKSCRNKITIIGEVTNDKRVDDLRDRIDRCIFKRDVWQSE